MRYRTIYVLAALTFVWAVVPTALAHNTGASWENNVGNYHVDIGYDPVTIQAGQPERFDFDAFTLPSETQEADFTDVWVRINQGENTIFATGIHRPSFGKPLLTFTFPSGGNYELDARFEKDGQSVVEESLPVTVTAADSSSTTTSAPSAAKKSSSTALAVGLLAVGLIVGALTRFIGQSKAKHETAK